MMVETMTLCNISDKIIVKVRIISNTELRRGQGSGVSIFNLFILFERQGGSKRRGGKKEST